MKKINLDVVLKDKEISLKPFPSSNIDSENLAKMMNDPLILKWTGHNTPCIYEIKNAKSFIKYAKEVWNSQEEYIFAIFKKDIYIGNISIKIDEDNNIVTSLVYWIGKEFWGNKYTTIAVSLLSKFCFRKLELRKIEAGVYEGNFASMKVLENNGFEVEGNKRKSYLYNEKALDKILYGKLNPKLKY